MDERDTVIRRGVQQMEEWQRRGIMPDEMFMLVHFGWKYPHLLYTTLIYSPWLLADMLRAKTYFESQILLPNENQKLLNKE